MIATIVTNGKKTARKKIDHKKYGQLLAVSLPKLISTEDENERYLAIVEALIDKGESISAEEEALLGLLSHLIAEFEQNFYKPEHLSPHEILGQLMALNGLKQSDLLHVFKSRGIASEVINGKRAISKSQAKTLASQFGVSTDLFL